MANATAPQYFRIKNWTEFQHYRDRTPPWIKLYNNLFENFDFECLSDSSKLHLILIWLLASRVENKIPYNNKWVKKKIGIDGNIDLKILLDAGYIERIDEQNQLIIDDASKVIAGCKHDASTEREERERRGREYFVTFWGEYPKRKGANPKSLAEKKFLKLIEKINPDILINAARQYAIDDQENLNTPYIAQTITWLNQSRWEQYEPEDQNRKTWEVKLEQFEKGIWPDAWGCQPAINGWKQAEHGEVPADLEARFIQIATHDNAGDSGRC